MICEQASSRITQGALSLPFAGGVFDRKGGGPARDLVESLALPSATIAQRYETYVVVTDAGRMFTGVITRQSREVMVLSDASGAESRIRTNEIDQMEMTKRSIMPETTIQILAREEVRDLLGYLQSLR